MSKQLRQFRTHIVMMHGKGHLNMSSESYHRFPRTKLTALRTPLNSRLLRPSARSARILVPSGPQDATTEPQPPCATGGSRGRTRKRLGCRGSNSSNATGVSNPEWQK
eukprot:scaffold599_cov282-Pinguiococcus_pyrenoidosus.AAC.3